MSEQALISIVDDDRSFRESMRRLIKSVGYAVAAHSSAAEFLACSQLSATACLVADVHMPAMSGIDLYRHLIQIGQAIPTILVTAYPDGNVQRRMVSEGVMCYLPKPLEEAELISCIRASLARQRASGEGPGREQ